MNDQDWLLDDRLGFFLGGFVDHPGSNRRVGLDDFLFKPFGADFIK